MESAPQPLAHLLEGAERVQLRGAHAPARKAAGCTLKRTQNVFSKARQSSLSLRARLLLAASLAHQRTAELLSACFPTVKTIKNVTNYNFLNPKAP